MKNIKWLINRLKAMELREILWRVKERQLQRKEKNIFYILRKPVTDIPLPSELAELHIDINKISINWKNKKWSRFEAIDLFGVYDYCKYKNKWNAGFQTLNIWPEEPFSPTIRINQKVDIGDIRTNWELNRHYQFAALAKSYYCTREKQYFTELKNLFDDWNEHNLFLHGVEWTSAMELAIRINSWIYTFAFLKKAGIQDRIIYSLENGIIVMADYISKHHAKFSSANNHLIIEMYAVALVGILTEYTPWSDKALRILTDEIQKQNYSDGVNKEMSLHYQGFVMEAYGLLCLLMVKNNIEIPLLWKVYLSNMVEFVADATDDFETTIKFGDDDDGKILDLNGTIDNYFQYILNLMGCILDKEYTDSDWHENLYWIVPERLRERKRKYVPKLVCCRKKGGYSFLRSKDRRILIGIDHAALGFGSIAAHGHADALSFQLYFDGEPVFVDPGTYNYHCGLDIRDAFRKTENHNTVTVDGKNQSEMLGAFLWGRRAECHLVGFENTSNKIVISAKHNGYRPIIHQRTFIFDRNRELYIVDKLSALCNYSLTFMLSPDAIVQIECNAVFISMGVCSCKIEFHSKNVFEIYVREAKISKRYGMQENIKAVKVKSYGTRIVSKITIWEIQNEDSNNKKNKRQDAVLDEAPFYALDS